LNFRPKVTAITESKDVDFILVAELVGSLQNYEPNLPKANKSKSMALKQLMRLMRTFLTMTSQPLKLLT